MKLKASNSTIDKAKEAERIAKEWLEKRGFRIEYWHEERRLRNLTIFWP